MSTTSNPREGEPRDPPTTVVSLLLVAMGAGIAGFAAWVDAGLLTLGFWFLFFPIGVSVLLTGLLLAVTDSFRPLTPIRAWVFPLGVTAALAVLVWYESHRLDLFWHPWTAAVVAASGGVPLGAAIKREQTALALTLGMVGVGLAIFGVVWPGKSLLFALTALGIILVILGIPATVLGHGLTTGVSD